MATQKGCGEPFTRLRRVYGPGFNNATFHVVSRETGTQPTNLLVPTGISSTVAWLRQEWLVDALIPVILYCLQLKAEISYPIPARIYNYTRLLGPVLADTPHTEHEAEHAWRHTHGRTGSGILSH